jgi:MATE family multidrug resistance protein
VDRPPDRDSDPAKHATVRGLLILAAPLILGMGANALMQFTDRWYLSFIAPVGLEVGYPAGITSYLLICLFHSSASYAATFAAQHHGADERRQCGPATWPALWLAVAAGIAALALIPALPVIYSTMELKPGSLAELCRLTAWYLAGAFPATVIAGVGGFFAGISRTRTVLLLNLLLLALNAGLNWCLIFGHLGLPALGVVGSGIGTFTATCATALVALALYFAPATSRVYGTWTREALSWTRLVRFLRFALPQGARVFIEVAAWVYFIEAVGALGPAPLAASNLVFSWNTLTFMPLIGMMQAIGVAVGQAQGAGRPDLARRATLRGLMLQVGWASVMAVVILVGCDQLIAVLLHGTDNPLTLADQEHIRVLSRQLMVINLLWGFGDAVGLTYNGALNGAGDTRWPFLLTLTASVALLVVPLAVIVNLDPARWRAWGIEPVMAAWASTLAFTFIPAALLAWRFQRGPWPSMTVRT